MYSIINGFQVITSIRLDAQNVQHVFQKGAVVQLNEIENLLFAYKLVYIDKKSHNCLYVTALFESLFLFNYFELQFYLISHVLQHYSAVELKYFLKKTNTADNLPTLM